MGNKKCVHSVTFLLIFNILLLTQCRENHFGVEHRKTKQLPFLSGFSVFNNNNNGGGIFGGGTTTRTVVRTVATVWTVSFRTCTTTLQNVRACGSGTAQGRRKRDSPFEPLLIEPTPAMQLIFAGTTISDQVEVEEYLNSFTPEITTITNEYGEESEPYTTTLYPTEDLLHDEYESDLDVNTTEFPSEGYEDNQIAQDEKDLKEWRAGLLRKTTKTTTISVTSVATSVHATDTLTIEYKGCLPQSLPVSGNQCRM